MKSMAGVSEHPLPDVVAQHVEESAFLCATRRRLVEAPHVRLHALLRHDERLAAHLDGVAVAGELGWALCEQALEGGGADEAFAMAVRAIEDADERRIARLLTDAGELASVRSGLLLALGWVSAPLLRKLVRELLGAPDALRRSWAVAGCMAHRVDPGDVLAAQLGEEHPSMREQALQAAGICGRTDLAGHCRAALQDADESCRLAAAAALALLGDHLTPLLVLVALATSPGPRRASALGWLLRLQTPRESAAILRPLARNPDDQRLLIRSIGMVGDPHHVPWLMDRMEEAPLARLAGESFSMITGLDLFGEGLHREAPEEPQESETGDDLALEEDEGLPWPKVDGARAWWSDNGARFASGVRHFCGAAPTPLHCLQVLREGGQRQRVAAAQWLCMLQPGTPMFNTAAPAWRQRRWLGDEAARSGEIAAR